MNFITGQTSKKNKLLKYCSLEEKDCCSVNSYANLKQIPWTKFIAFFTSDGVDALYLYWSETTLSS